MRQKRNPISGVYSLCLKEGKVKRSKTRKIFALILILFIFTQYCKRERRRKKEILLALP